MVLPSMTPRTGDDLSERAQAVAREREGKSLAEYMCERGNAVHHIRGALGWDELKKQYGSELGTPAEVVVGIDRLRMDGCDMTNEDVRRMGKFISLPECTHLSLGNNPQITADCAADLAKLLTRAPKLRVFIPPSHLTVTIYEAPGIGEKERLHVRHAED